MGGVHHRMFLFSGEGNVASTLAYVLCCGHALDLFGPHSLATESLDDSTHSGHTNKLLQVPYSNQSPEGLSILPKDT